MKGFLFISDAVFGVLILTFSLMIALHVVSSTSDVVAHQTVASTLQKTSEHAINVLLFSENNAFRCTYGLNNIPVPLCVWNNGATENLFWADRKPNCAVSSSNTTVETELATMLGCSTTLPSSYRNLVTVSFKVCWASSTTDSGVERCDLVDANLIVWT